MSTSSSSSSSSSTSASTSISSAAQPAVWDEWLGKLANDDQRTYARTVFEWVASTYPELECAIKWNQPMFMHHGTFIIGFSFSSKNLLIGTEGPEIEHFHEKIIADGYTHTKKLIRFGFDQPIGYELLAELIDFNMAVKKDMTTFWRP